MNDKKVKVCLKILILNDIFSSNVIDKEIYEKALKNIREEEI